MEVEPCGLGLANASDEGNLERPRRKVASDPHRPNLAGPQSRPFVQNVKDSVEIDGGKRLKTKTMRGDKRVHSNYSQTYETTDIHPNVSFHWRLN